MSRSYHFQRSLTILIAGVWIGVLVFLGYGVAGTIFRMLESKTQAGLINGAILVRMNHLEWVCALVLLLLSLASVIQNRSKYARIQMAIVIVCTINLWFYSSVLTDDITDIKSLIQNFDMPRESDPRPERAEFDRLHRWYSSLVVFNVVLIGTAAAISMVGREPKHG